MTNDNIKHSIFMINIDKDFSRYSILHFDDAKYGSSVVDDDNALSLLYFSKSKHNIWGFSFSYIKNATFNWLISFHQSKVASPNKSCIC